MVPTDPLEKIPEEYRRNFMLDNDGNMVANNRAHRRKKPPADNWYNTKKESKNKCQNN
jgi:predicted transcriptional regulator